MYRNGERVPSAFISSPSFKTSHSRCVRSFTETQSKLTVSSRILLTNPSDSPEYQLRLYPHALERSALLTQNEAAELCAIEGSQAAYDEEKGRVEDEWRNRKDKMRERLLDGLEERRRKAREEMASDGVLAGELFGFSLSAWKDIYGHGSRRPGV